jgi:DNA-binding IclR family transcriptional regulator
MQVKQISNLFQLMELLAKRQRPLSVAEIVSALEWPRSSVFNIVSTLVDEGYLFQPVARGGYSPTSRWMELAKSLVETHPLPAALHQQLVALMELTGETVFLAAAEGTSVVFLDVVEPPANIRFAANVGQRLPIHVTAAGKAILAQCSTAERVALLRRVQFDATGETSIEQVVADVVRYQDRGWYTNMGQYAPGVAGIAVPFPYADRRLAIALGGPVSRVEEHADQYGQLLRQTVDTLLKTDC